MVVRQNPMGGDMSGLAVTGTVTASLVGTHALSASNHIVSPKHGTAMSHCRPRPISPKCVQVCTLLKLRERRI